MSRHGNLHRVFEERLSRERASVRCVDAAARLRAVLVYPSPYRVGMSSLGYQQVYRAWNSVEGACCDRAFLPDDVAAWRAARAPLVGIETGRPVGGFDLVGISLAYELELAGVVETLQLSGLSPLAADRRPADPPVVLGGPLTFSNPLPAYPFADVVVLGESEAVDGALLRARLETTSKAEFLEAVHGLPGVIVPSVDGGQLGALARAPDHALPARSAIVTPDTELRDMFLVEPERGCHRPCTYCVMRRPDKGSMNLVGGGMRLLDPDRVLSLVPDYARRVGLVGAAVTDHPKIRDVVRAVVESGREVGISSLRADRLDDELVGLLQQGGYRTLTTAADGASERLRKMIRRGTKNKHLLESARLVKEHGLRELKLYMMLGLPSETDADIDELTAFSLELASACRVSLSIAPFVAKKNTPLDGTPYAGIKLVEQRISRLKKGLRGRVVVRPTSARWAWVEYQLAQGGPEHAAAALAATAAGGSFGDWKRAFAALESGDLDAPG